MSDDMTLVREFVASRSEQAFATLVDRHIGLVYMAAARQAGDADLAREIAQAVFIILARKAASLGPKTILSAWLYRTTSYVAADAIKSRRRRQAREQEAYMQSTLDQSATDTWAQLAPQLDEAMAELGEADRTALVLRYFENKSAREIAGAMGMEETTAQKRVSRALEKLRGIFQKRGVTLTATVIASAVAANAVSAAPIGLGGVVTATALQGAAASGSTLVLVKGALKWMAWARFKTAIAGGVMLIAATAAVVLLLPPQSQGIAAPAASPLDLTAYYDVPATNFWQAAPKQAWGTVPTGQQVFDNVPLQIDGFMCLWGGGNAETLHEAFHEQITGIRVGQKFEALYIYHCCFFKSPEQTPVCDVVFRYHDGSSVTNSMLYDDDFIDWVANVDPPVIGPSGPNSALAWVGGNFVPGKKRPIRLCMTAIDNPKTNLVVETIDLYSCKSHTAPCILAMTTGKTGLMK